jgi:hypothetical protein
LASEVANDDGLFTVVTPSNLGALVVAGATDFKDSGPSRSEGTK